MLKQPIITYCTHMVEVDVHALELEVGGTVVPNKISAAQSTTRNPTLNLLSIAIETVLTGDSLPVIQSENCEPMTRKKFQYICLHVPESGTNLVTLSSKSNLVPIQKPFAKVSIVKVELTHGPVWR